MTDPQSSSTAPLPNPDGRAVYSPKILGQQAIIRQEISQFSSTNVGLQIIINDVLANPDVGGVSAWVYQKTDFTDEEDWLGTIHNVDTILNPEPGIFSFSVGPEFTNQLGFLTVKWAYVVDGDVYEFWDYYQVRVPMPIYDTLNEGERGVVTMVQLMFGDLYDSVDGGPHLKEEFQTKFGTETIAMCLVLGGARLNRTSQPYTNYVIGDGVQGSRWPTNAYSLLVMSTYLEVVHHLIRSYVEQPSIEGGMNVRFVDRRDYMDRWEKILQIEMEDFKDAVRSFKRSLLGLGGGNLIVSGGIFGYANYFRGGQWAMAARSMRFYPYQSVVIRR